MTQRLYFGDLAFEDNFVFAYTNTQEKIKFSKHERALLKKFITHPEKLLTRSILLDCVQETSTETFDRNIDYLLSRLRRKLRDSSQNPQYIATQYGEGYIWVAKSRHQSPDTSNNIFLSVSSVYGLAQDKKTIHMTSLFSNALFRALLENFSAEHCIELLTEPMTEASLENRQRHNNSRYAVELSFLKLNHSVHCILVVLNRRTGQILATFRRPFSSVETPEKRQDSIEQLAMAIKSNIWDALIFRSKEPTTIANDCLAVGMYTATQLFEPGQDNSVAIENKLRDRLQENPGDHATAILLATNMHSQIYAGNFDQLEDREKEIEILIFEHLPYIQGNALYLASVAERLYELGHVDLAENLAERALDIGSSFSACYMVLGRIKIYQGHILEGLSYYELSEAMTEKDSTFFLLLQIRKCIAFKALGDKKQVDDILAYILPRVSGKLYKTGLQLFFLADNPKALGIVIKAQAALIPKAAAFHTLKLLHHTSVKHFKNPLHRLNLLRGMVSLFVDRFGEDIVDEPIKQCVPELFYTIKKAG